MLLVVTSDFEAIQLRIADKVVNLDYARCFSTGFDNHKTMQSKY